MIFSGLLKLKKIAGMLSTTVQELLREVNENAIWEN